MEETGLKLVDVEQYNKKIANMQKRLDNSREFFNEVADLFRCKYNDISEFVAKAHAEGKTVDLRMYLMVEAHLIQRINETLKILEKYGEKVEYIKYDYNKLWF